MSELVQGMLMMLLPSLFVSVVTAVVTVRLSERRFRKEKWWEMQVAAYSDIFERLTDLQYCYGEWWKHFVHEKNLNVEKRKALTARREEAEESLARAAARGGLWVSAKVAHTVRDLLRELGSPGQHDPADIVAIIDEDYGRVEQSITKVRGYAKEHLKVERI